MASMGGNTRDTFSSKAGVIAAAAGSAVGLGNIWRFPYETGVNGGGAFLLIYLGFIIVIGLPVMLSEFVIGRRAGSNAFGAFKKLKPNQPWYVIGLIGIVAAFLILSFYSTIAGWTLEYLYQSISDNLSGKNGAELTQQFDTFKASVFRPIMWQLIFMFLTAFIVFSGVRNGIEKYTKILMPLLVLLIMVIAAKSLSMPGAKKGLEFLFKPDFTKITWGVVLSALGQAAFSLSIGMGALITYGSYIKKSNNLGTTAFQVSLADSAIAILAGIMIFPAVFATPGVEPTAGFGLVFIVLPGIFNQMAGGYVFAIIFFILLTVAALTSTVSLLEVVTAYFSEELNLKRQKATIIGAVSIATLGIFSTLSFSTLSEFKILGMTIFELFNEVSADWMLPMGAFLIIVFLGWFLGGKHIRDELSNGGKLKIRFYKVFIFIIKFVAPIAIALVFLYGLGLFGK